MPEPVEFIPLWTALAASSPENWSVLLESAPARSKSISSIWYLSECTKSLPFLPIPN